MCHGRNDSLDYLVIEKRNECMFRENNGGRPFDIILQINHVPLISSISFTLVEVVTNLCRKILTLLSPLMYYKLILSRSIKALQGQEKHIERQIIKMSYPP